MAFALGRIPQDGHGAWWLLEFLPKLAKYKEWPARQVVFGFYIPDGEPRPIPSKLALSYRDRTIAITFSALAYGAPARNRYRGNVFVPRFG